MLNVSSYDFICKHMYLQVTYFLKPSFSYELPVCITFKNPSFTHQQKEDMSLGMRLGSPSETSLVYNDQSRTSSALVACIFM